MSTAAKAPRVAHADVLGCEACKFYQPSMLFTLCTAKDAEYRVDGDVQHHTIQHMRDEFVGLCGLEMKLRKIEKPKSGRKWDRGNL